MWYYVEYDSRGYVSLIGACSKEPQTGVEITKEEHDRLLTEIREKAALENKLYNGEITIDDVPEAWREEIQRRVDERIAADGEAAMQDISAKEALDIIIGGEGA